MSHVNGSDDESSRTASTTGASFMPDSSSSAPESRLLTPTPRSTLKTAAASVEDSTAPHSSAVRQSRSEQEVQRGPDDADADQHRHGGERDAEAERGAHRAPVGGEPALGQDEDEGREPERLGERGVVELDAQHATRRAPSRCPGRAAARAGRAVRTPGPRRRRPARPPPRFRAVAPGSACPTLTIAVPPPAQVGAHPGESPFPARRVVVPGTASRRHPADGESRLRDSGRVPGRPR